MEVPGGGGSEASNPGEDLVLERVKSIRRRRASGGSGASDWHLFLEAMCRRQWAVMEYLAFGEEAAGEEEEGPGDVDVDRCVDGFCLLHRAAETGDLEAVIWLVTRMGADVDVKDFQGRRPLHLAAENGNLPIVQFLVTRGACDPEAANHRSWRALHAAAQAGHLPVVKWLIQECGVDAEAATEAGGRALHVAAWRLELASFLVHEAGVDVDARDARGRSALHLVTLWDRPNAVRFFVQETDIDIFVLDAEGRRASQLAEQKGHAECLSILQEAEEIQSMMKSA